MRPPTDHELNTLPHFIMTSDLDWDPTILDHTFNVDSGEWYSDDDLSNLDLDNSFDSMGDYKHHQLFKTNVNYSSNLTTDELIYDLMLRYVFNIHLTKQEPDYAALQPHFGWAPVEVIKQTFAVTTQYARSQHLYDDVRKHYKSRFPAMNVARQNEPVATDTIYSDVAAVDYGSKYAQFFVGLETWFVMSMV
jgi:hypothetical protein